MLNIKYYQAHKYNVATEASFLGNQIRKWLQAVSTTLHINPPIYRIAWYLSFTTTHTSSLEAIALPLVSPYFTSEWHFTLRFALRLVFMVVSFVHFGVILWSNKTVKIGIQQRTWTKASEFMGSSYPSYWKVCHLFGFLFGFVLRILRYEMGLPPTKPMLAFQNTPFQFSILSRETNVLRWHRLLLLRVYTIVHLRLQAPSPTKGVD